MNTQTECFEDAIDPVWHPRQRFLTFTEHTDSDGGRQEVRVSFWPSPEVSTRAPGERDWSCRQPIDLSQSWVVHASLAGGFAALAGGCLPPSGPVSRALSSVPHAVRSEVLAKVPLEQAPCALRLASCHPGFTVLARTSPLLAILLVRTVWEARSRRRRASLLDGISTALEETDRLARLRAVIRFVPVSDHSLALRVLSKASVRCAHGWWPETLALLEQLMDDGPAAGILRQLTHVPAHMPACLQLLQHVDGGLSSLSAPLIESIADLSDDEAMDLRCALHHLLSVHRVLGRPIDAGGIDSASQLRDILRRAQATLLELCTRSLTLDTPGPFASEEHPQPERDPRRLRRALAVLFRDHTPTMAAELQRIWSGCSTILHLHGPGLPFGGWALVDRSDCGHAWTLRVACSTLGGPLALDVRVDLEAKLARHSLPVQPPAQWRKAHASAFGSRLANARRLPGRTWVAAAHPSPDVLPQLRLLHGPLQDGRVHTLHTLHPLSVHPLICQPRMTA